MTIDREMMNELSSRIEHALADIGLDLGIAVKVGRGKYGGTTGSITLDVGLVSEDGKIDTKEAVTFRERARLYGLEPEDLGRTFQFRGTLYEITGLNHHRPRFPISAKRQKDGRGFKFPATAVKNNLTPRIEA